MKKILLLTAGLLLLGTNVLFAQADDFDEYDPFSEEALFGSSDDPFSDESMFGSSDDDFFLDDGIIDISETQTNSSDSLKHGELFENGSIKIGGSFSTGFSTSTVLYMDQSNVAEADRKSFGDRVSETALSPQLSALLSVDARPTQTLRMYTKFGIAYPFASSAVSSATTTGKDLLGKTYYTTTVTTSVSDYIQLKELFTDFSAADRVFFRFGKHTVTWGTGLFYSPVSDMINTSSIDPEDINKQVDGSLNLRTQITFPGTQNCLWFYVIPSSSLAKDTAVAAKADLVFGGWELGFGGFYKYHDSPRAMLTATGTLFKKLSVFGEAVYQYGTANEWAKDTSFNNKTNFFLVTAGGFYTWKTPSITLMAQYFYDSYNDKNLDLTFLTMSDIQHNYGTKGHNVAAMLSFGKIFGSTDLTASLLGIVNFGREEIPAVLKMLASSSGVAVTDQPVGIFTASLSWSPFKNFSMSGGPRVTFTDFKDKPVVSFALSASLGGGKF